MIDRVALLKIKNSRKPQIKKPEGMSREVFALLVQDPSSAAYTGVPLVPTPRTTGPARGAQICLL